MSSTDRLRRLAFALLYGPAAPIYDRFTRWLFLGEWARWQQTVLPLLPETGPVVELGAGTAALARVAARPGRVWVAIEPSRRMLRAARRTRLPASCTLVWATAGALPIRDGAAVAVVATFPGPYILAAETAAEIHRVLRPGGRVLVVLDGRLAPDGLRRRLRRTALRGFYGRSADAANDPAPVAFTMPGFAAGRRSLPTAHGHADLFIGTRVGRSQDR